jgi:hypothetical protein
MQETAAGLGIFSSPWSDVVGAVSEVVPVVQTVSSVLLVVWQLAKYVRHIFTPSALVGLAMHTKVCYVSHQYLWSPGMLQSHICTHDISIRNFFQLQDTSRGY